MTMRPLSSLRAWALAAALVPVVGGASAALAPASVWACGGTFCSNSPIIQNAERVLFLKRPGDPRTTAVVQIQAQGNDPDFAWVVPLDSVPEDIHEEPSNTFRQLDSTTSPTYLFFNGARFGVGGGSGGFGCGSAEASTAGGSPREDSATGVRVWAQGETGNYAYSVVSSEDPEALRQWLDNNRYVTPAEALPIIREYVDEHKYFLAVRLRAVQGVPSFLVAPLAFTYQGRGPCVPIRLTRIATLPTLPIITYVVSDRRAVPINFAQTTVPDAEVARLGPMRFSAAAGPASLSAYDELVRDAVTEAGGRAWITEYAGELPDGVAASLSPALQAQLPQYPYLTRMYTTISASAMDRDPEFVFAQGLPDVSNVHDLTEYTDRSSLVDGRFLGLSSLAGALGALVLRRRRRTVAAG